VAEFDGNVATQNGTVTRLDAALARSLPIYPSFPASAGLVYEYANIPPRLVGREGIISFGRS
jgi:hypothetical protein